MKDSNKNISVNRVLSDMADVCRIIGDAAADVHAPARFVQLMRICVDSFREALIITKGLS